MKCPCAVDIGRMTCPLLLRRIVLPVCSRHRLSRVGTRCFLSLIIRLDVVCKPGGCMTRSTASFLQHRVCSETGRSPVRSPGIPLRQAHSDSSRPPRQIQTPHGECRAAFDFGMQLLIRLTGSRRWRSVSSTLPRVERWRRASHSLTPN